MGKQDRHISLLAVPEVTLSTLTGLYDVFRQLSTLVPASPPITTEILAPDAHLVSTASGLPLTAHKTLREVSDTDIIIVSSLLLPDGHWQTGRYPPVVGWLRQMYRQGATLCSACSGVLLLAETGLLDGGEATLHCTGPMSALSATTFPRCSCAWSGCWWSAGPGSGLSCPARRPPGMIWRCT